MLSPNLSENLKIINACPVCKQKFNPIEAKLLEEKDGAHLLHVKCNKCSSSVLVLIFVNQFGVNSIGLIVDLEADEILKFTNLSPVSSDNVLDFHLLLKDNINIFKLLSNTYGKNRITSTSEKGER